MYTIRVYKVDTEIIFTMRICTSVQRTGFIVYGIKLNFTILWWSKIQHMKLYSIMSPYHYIYIYIFKLN